MTKKVMIPIALTLLAAAAFAGDARVDNIDLAYQDGQTAARIQVNGVVRFTHQTEVAKDGRPYRVIVDLLSAQHHLGAKEFLDLPPAVVTGIRTSQYSVKPEMVVRVVFDMARETVYRVESGTDYVRILFPDKQAKPFAAWSSQKALSGKAARPAVGPLVPETAAVPAPKEKSTKQLNAALDRDRLASLQAGDKVKTPTKKAPAPTGEPLIRPKMGQKPATAKAEFYGPYIDANLLTQDRTEAKALAEASHQQTAPAQPATASRPAQKATPAATPGPIRSASGTSAGKFLEADKYADSSPKKAAPAPLPPAKPESKPKQTLAQAPPKTEPASKPETAPSKTATAQATKAATPAEKPVAVAEKQVEEKQVKQRSTAHFRRDPADVRKAKGTMVAEFPKRLVVKYKTGSRRDPFETLINEGKVYSDPIKQKVPNIDGLRLVGVMETEGGDNRALFQDADDYGYILKAGDRVRKGYVLRVEVDRVYFQIFEYGWSRTVALNLDED